MPAKMADRPDESCPVCKQSTYLNPNMKFKINPDCYHRMCDSCIERIFHAGPAPCPVAGCKKTLRRKGFRTQTFGDLSIERECDIRRRVNGVLNKREDEFETLRDFNDYQETKEDIAWKLIYNIDVSATEKLLKQYMNDNKASISINMEREDLEREQAKELEQQRAQRAAAGRADMKREFAEERAAKGMQAKGVVDSIMGASGDPEEAARQARQRVAQQQRVSVARKDRTESQVQSDAQRLEGGLLGSASENKPKGGLAFAGLRKAEKQSPQGPYDPFDGMRLVTKLYKVKADDTYQNSHLDEARGDTDMGKVMRAGGFSTVDYCRHALFDAHAGLGIVLSKEIAQSVT